MHTNIEWRAFWISFGTIILALILFYIVLQPLIRKYKVQVVNDDDDKKAPEVKTAA